MTTYTPWVNKADLTTFAASITGLTHNTQYDVKAQLQDTNNPNMGIIDGDIETFTTTKTIAPVDGTYDNAPPIVTGKQIGRAHV